MELRKLYNSTKFIERDKAFRKKFNSHELTRNVLLSISKDQHLPVPIRLGANLQLEQLSGYRSNIHNRCILTGRGRGILRNYKVSRMTFRKLIVNGYLAGISKASW